MKKSAVLGFCTAVLIALIIEALLIGVSYVLGFPDLVTAAPFLASAAVGYWFVRPMAPSKPWLYGAAVLAVVLIISFLALMVAISASLPDDFQNAY